MCPPNASWLRVPLPLSSTPRRTRQVFEQIQLSHQGWGRYKPAGLGVRIPVAKSAPERYDRSRMRNEPLDRTLRWMCAGAGDKAASRAINEGKGVGWPQASAAGPISRSSAEVAWGWPGGGGAAEGSSRHEWREKESSRSTPGQQQQREEGRTGVWSYAPFEHGRRLTMSMGELLWIGHREEVILEHGAVASDWTWRNGPEEASKNKNIKTRCPSGPHDVNAEVRANGPEKEKISDSDGWMNSDPLLDTAVYGHAPWQCREKGTCKTVE
ncbi:hypothetical protein BC826DRAFT_966799 [Russula brevipes]|nr:hypothetical protein BC826DRAFT_966799 [Russula brevipes]